MNRLCDLVLSLLLFETEPVCAMSQKRAGAADRLICGERKLRFRGEWRMKPLTSCERAFARFVGGSSAD